MLNKAYFLGIQVCQDDKTRHHKIFSQFFRYFFFMIQKPILQQI